MKAGDRIVCIDDSVGLNGMVPDLIKDKLYTHAGDCDECPDCGHIILGEFHPRFRFGAHRFRKVDDNWAEEVLRIAQEEQESDKELIPLTLW